MENLEKLSSKFLLKKCAKRLIFWILNFLMLDFLGKNGVLKKKKIGLVDVDLNRLIKKCGWDNKIF